MLKSNPYLEIDVRVLLVFTIMLLAGCTSTEPNHVATPPATIESVEEDGNGTTANEVPPELPRGNETDLGESGVVPKVQSWEPTVVIADVSSGFNPYHEAHRRPGWPHPCQRVVGLPCSMPTVEITLNTSFSEARGVDADLWANLEPGLPVWLNGTNIIFEYQRLNGDNPIAFDPGFHGTATVGAVNDACPECYTFAYQDQQSLDGEPVRTLAAYPWVDFVVSTNWPGNLDRTVGHLLEGPYADATRSLYEAGGIFFGAAGNHPVTGLMDVMLPFPYNPIMWPPWVAMVSGHLDDCGSRVLYSGQLTEFTAQFEQDLPRSETISGRGMVAGTSFSAPRAAGLWGEVLRQVYIAHPPTGSGALWEGEPGPGLLADGELNQAELREVMAAAATLYDVGDYQAGCGAGYGSGRPQTTPGPWESGWGNMDDFAVAIAIDYLVKGTALPEKAANHQASMEAFRDSRAAMYPW